MAREGDPDFEEEAVSERTNWEPQEPEMGGDWEKPPIPPWVKPLVIVLVILAVGAGLLYWKRAAIRHHANEWTAERHLAKAEEELAADRPKIAVRRAMTSLGLKQNRIETLRVLLVAGRQSNDARLLDFSDVVFRHPEATTQDRAEALGAINDVGDGARFEDLFRSLDEETRTDEKIHYEWLRSRLIQGRPEALIAALEDTDLEGRSDLLLLKWQALIQLRSAETDVEAGKVALQLVEGFATQEDSGAETGVGDFVESLAYLPASRWEPETAIRMAELIEGSELNSLESWNPTLPFNLALVAEPESREAILDEATEELSDNEASLDQLCLWLQRLEEAERILALIDSMGGARSPAVYECQVNALVALEKFEDAMGLMEFPIQGVDRIELFAMKARVAKTLGRRSEESGAWREALIEAERDLTQNHYLKLTRLAQAAGEQDVAVEALVEACRNPRGVLPPTREVGWVMGRLAKEDRAEDLFVVVQRLLNSERSHPVLINNAVYLNALRNQSSREGEIAVMEALVEANRGLVQMRTTLALGYVLNGKTEEAMAVMEPEIASSVNWQELSPSGRAVFALVLAEAGDAKFFRSVYELIAWDELLALEKEFFEEAFAPHLEEEDEEAVSVEAAAS